VLVAEFDVCVLILCVGLPILALILAFSKVTCLSLTTVDHLKCRLVHFEDMILSMIVVRCFLV
jgi:hypothetical protein